jgi:hypothetical protein
VRHLKTTLCALLVVLWVPLFSHCLLERAGVWSADDCCTENAGSAEAPCNAPCSDQICCDQIYKAADRRPDVAAPVPVLLEQVLAPCDESTDGSQAPFDSLTTSPPELPVLWQFSSRAALPPRAPSPVS